MKGNTITREHLDEPVYQQLRLSRKESAEHVDKEHDEETQAHVRSAKFTQSSFGSFLVRLKGERVGRNPKTGEEVPIKPRRVLVFRASHVLKDRVNKGAEKQP